MLMGQNFNDPKIRGALRKAGISVREAKEFIGKNQTIDSNSNIISSETNNDNDSEVELQFIKDFNAKDISVNSIGQDSKIVDNRNDSLDDDDGNIIDTLSSIITDVISPLYFGYNAFNGNPELFQKSLSESIDPNYVVGPGDEIIIMLWGETEMNKSFLVSADGYLFIEN